MPADAVWLFEIIITCIVMMWAVPAQLTMTHRSNHGTLNVQLSWFLGFEFLRYSVKFKSLHRGQKIRTRDTGCWVAHFIINSMQFMTFQIIEAVFIFLSTARVFYLNSLTATFLSVLATQETGTPHLIYCFSEYFTLEHVLRMISEKNYASTA